MVKSKLRVRFTLFLIICCSNLIAGNQYLIINQKDGKQVCFALFENPVIECVSGQLSVNSDRHSISIPLAYVNNYSFADNAPTSVPTINYKNGNIDVHSGRVIIDSMPSNTIVSIFGIDGVSLSSYLTDSDGHLEFMLPKYHKAVIIKANSISIKIANK